MAAQPLGRDARHRQFTGRGHHRLDHGLARAWDRESGTVNAVIVAIKLAIVLFFIAIGIGHIDVANYHLPAGPTTGAGGFMPFGWGNFFGNGPGVLGGAAFIFFAYIGFDAVSTTAEEARNPGKDLPFGIIASLVICTFLYIIVVAILNGMVPFNELNVAYPVAFAVNHVGIAWAAVIISFGAIAGLTTVLLVMMYGQTRIFYSMSRDGLIPPSFTRLHPTWRTPVFSQIFFGILIAAAGALFPIGILGSLTNMGTLMAFCLVACAVPALRKRHPRNSVGSFTVPFGPYVIPVLSLLSRIRIDLLLEERQPAGVGVLPPRVARVPDLARRRARLLLQLRPPQEHRCARRSGRGRDRPATGELGRSRDRQQHDGFVRGAAFDLFGR